MWPCSELCGPLEQPLTCGAFQIPSIQLLIHAYVVARGHGTVSVRATGRLCRKKKFGRAIIHIVTIKSIYGCVWGPRVYVGFGIGGNGICCIDLSTTVLIYPQKLNGTLHPGQLWPGIPTAESFSRRLWEWPATSSSSSIDVCVCKPLTISESKKTI